MVGLVLVSNWFPVQKKSRDELRPVSSYISHDGVDSGE